MVETRTSGRVWQYDNGSRKFFITVTNWYTAVSLAVCSLLSDDRFLPPVSPFILTFSDCRFLPPLLAFILTGSAVTEMTLQAYVDYMFGLNSTSFDGNALYVFDRKQFFNNATDLYRQYYRHDIFKNYPADQTFTIGASGMGIPFHFHMDGWLEVRIILNESFYS